MSACVKCGERVDEELRVPFRECSHRVHADCLLSDPEETRSYKKCGLCLGHYAPAEKKAGGGEPRLIGSNRDWVLNPGARPGGFRTLANLLPMTKKDDPLALLERRVPVDELMSQHKIGLDHCLEAGIVMRDFLQNGYTWDSVLQFEDVSRRGPKRALQAVANGLRTTANDFRDYPDALPLERVREHTRFKNADLCRLFQLEFPSGGSLSCRGDENWSALDCVEMGLKFTDLMDCGMRYLHQYDALFATLSESEAEQSEQALGTNQALLNRLIDANALEEVEARAPRVEYAEDFPLPSPPPPPARAAFNPPAPRAIVPQQSLPLLEKRIRERSRRHGIK